MIFKPFLREGFIPLPVTFISTLSKTGVRNIAPYSCIMPILRPLDLVCIATAYKRDTYVNIQDTHEFVINLAGDDFVHAVIPTARFTGPEVDEFELAGLKEKPSETIKPPGIAGCYSWMECVLDKLYKEDEYILIIGRVQRLEVRDDVLNPDNSLDLEKARPLMMTGNNKEMFYSTVKNIKRGDDFASMFPDGKDPVHQGK